jgi:hypothetical protein
MYRKQSSEGMPLGRATWNITDASILRATTSLVTQVDLVLTGAWIRPDLQHKYESCETICCRML